MTSLPDGCERAEILPVPTSDQPLLADWSFAAVVADDGTGGSLPAVQALFRAGSGGPPLGTAATDPATFRVLGVSELPVALAI